MKRSLNEGDGPTSSSKRLRASSTPSNGAKIKHHRLNHVQPNTNLLFQHPQEPSSVHTQLSRAICVALYSAGFTSVQRRALESFTAAVEEYMLHFSHRVAQSMLTSRRHRPLPQDFIHALAAFNLTSSALEPDLDLPIPSLVTQPSIAEHSSANTNTSSTFIVPTLPFPSAANTTSISARKRHIPSHFPLLPPSHAYKETPIFTARETDARRIRERATEEGMAAEKALRKLVKASKAGGRKKRLVQASVNTMDENMLDKEEEIWKETLAGLGDEERNGEPGMELPPEKMHFGMDGAGDTRPVDGVLEANAEMEAGMMVNYERAFWRKANRGGTGGTV